MHYNLFLDDLRSVEDVTYLSLPYVDWTIVRSYEEFKEALAKQGIPQIVSFDHDLTGEHYPTGSNSADDIIPYDEYETKTGLACAKELVDACDRACAPIPTCYVHSFNQAGRKNIMDLLIRSGAKNIITYKL